MVTESIPTTVAPTLYNKAKTGAILEWTIEIWGDKYRTISGQLNSPNLVTGAWTTAKAVNVGKANETTPEQQAMQEAMAKHKLKMDEGYRTTIEALEEARWKEPMLAHDFKKVYAKKTLTFPVYVQPKLDGVRCIVTRHGMFSRQGRPLVSAPHIHEQLKHLFDITPELELDGELYAHHLSDNFDKIISMAKRTKPTVSELAESAEHLEYHVYDIRDSERTFCVRNELIQSLVFGEKVKKVETSLCSTQEDLDASRARFVTEGYEGAMVRFNTNYEFCRSNSLLKLKDMITEDFEILDITPGDGIRADMAGRIHFKTENQGKEGTPFRAGIQGTHEYCAELLKNKANYIGKVATVKFQNWTPAPDSVPRFPVMVAIRDYE